MEKLPLIYGDPYVINSHITIKHPTVGLIKQYGEDRYWQLVSLLTSTSYDIRFQLDDMGFDYEDIDDFAVFCMIAPGFSQEETSIILGDLDLSQLEVTPSQYDDICLANEDQSVVIDRVIYELMVKQIRTINGLKRNYKIAGNKRARKFYMEEERKMLEQKAQQRFDDDSSSNLEPLIGFLVNNSNFKYDYESVLQLPIYTFMDAAKRVTKLINYQNLMTGIYTGNIDSKKIPKKQMDLMGEI